MNLNRCRCYQFYRFVRILCYYNRISGLERTNLPFAHRYGYGAVVVDLDFVVFKFKVRISFFNLVPYRLFFRFREFIRIRYFDLFSRRI